MTKSMRRIILFAGVATAIIVVLIASSGYTQLFIQ